MAKYYSSLPQKHIGEKDLAQDLISIPDDKMHLWLVWNLFPTFVI
jgi:hypothetical protein